MTLTEFLEARIAEDEAVARHSLNGDIEYLPSLTTKHGDVLYLGVTHPARVLAECEAKRRIVERWRYLIRHGDTGLLEWVAKVLALPYADHPDYPDEWKP
jgi:hypothetical protein